jgi:peroxiredoxin
LSGKVFSLIIIALLLFSARLTIGGKIVPDFTLTDIDGVEFSLSDYRGKVVLLSLFSTLCGPCITEIPHLKHVHEEFSEDLIIISISVRQSDTVEKLQQFRQEHEIDWIIARDTVGIREKLGGLWTIPTLIIIDKQGYIRYIPEGLTGPCTLSEEIGYIISCVLIGDINGDGKVDKIDVSTVAKSFGSRLGDERWNEAADLNNDGIINIIDIALVALQYGKSETFNFLLNPSVEIDENGNNSPEYWQKGDYGDVGVVCTWLDTGYMGNHSVKISITHNASAWHSAQWYQSFRIQYSPFEIGSRYLFRFWYKSSIKCYIYASFCDVNDQWITGQSAECEPATIWTLSQWLEFTIPEATYHVGVGILVKISDAAQETNAYAIGDYFQLIQG